MSKGDLTMPVDAKSAQPQSTLPAQIRRHLMYFRSHQPKMRRINRRKRSDGKGADGFPYMKGTTVSRAANAANKTTQHTKQTTRHPGSSCLWE